MITTMPKNFNKLWAQGFEITDNEIVKDFNLDPSLANTNGINFAMLDNVFEKNVNGFIKLGMTKEKARAAAGRLRAEAKQQIKELQA